MEKTFFCILLLLCWATTSTKYVYIDDKKTWVQAQEHCRQNYTDLAHVSVEKDNQRLQEKNLEPSWFGLHRDPIIRNRWLWSGGGEVSKFYWGGRQPDDRSGEDYGKLYSDGWHDSTDGSKEPFLCFNPIVVTEQKTWEEAIRYCRQHHNDLASLLSETESMLIGKALLKTNIMQPVWIGLHFFSGKWLWVDGEMSDYKAWSDPGEPMCPKFKQVCAALQTKSVVPNAEAILEAGLYSLVVLREWKACNCDDRLPFICY